MTISGNQGSVEDRGGNVFARLWTKWTRPQADNEADARREYMTKVILVINSLISFPFTLFSLVGWLLRIIPLDTVLIFGTMTVLFILAWFMVHHGRWQLAGGAIPCLVFLTAGLYGNYVGGIDAPAMVLYALAIILAGIMLDTRYQFILLALSLAGYLGFGLAHYTGCLPSPRSASNMFVNRVTIVFAALTAISSGVWFLKTQYQRSITQVRAYAASTRLVFETVTDGIVLTDLDGTILDLNEAMVHLFQFKNKQRAVGQNALDLLNPADILLARAFYHLILAGTPGKLFSGKGKLADGGEIFLEVTASLYRDSKGQPSGFVSTVRDITQRKRIEEEQKTAEENMRYFTEGTHAIFWRAHVTQFINEQNGEVDFHWDTHYANLETVNKFIPMQDFPGQSMQYRFFSSEVEEDRVRMHQHSAHAIRNRLGGYSQEFRLIDALGHLHWMNDEARITQVAEKQFEAVGLITEITDRKRGEEQIYRLNAELEQKVQIRTAELSDLYHNAPCGYQSLDSAGYFVQINDTELKWLGYTREELLNKTRFSDLLTPFSFQVYQDNIPILIDSGVVNDLEFGILCKDGSILPVLVSSTVVKDAAGNFSETRSTMIDHSNRKRIEAEISKSQQRLEKSNQELTNANNELEAFTYSVSHDLRQPLRVIEGYSHILKEEYGGELNPEGLHLLDSIQKNSKKMDQLIMDLLALSRVSRSELKFSKIAMSDLVQTVFEEIAPPEKDKKFEFCLSPLPDSSGDFVLIQQVWINLISNAIKYTLPNKERKIEIGSYPENGMNVYFIRDNGVGFDPAYAHKLFGVFQRLHSASEFEGTGVGLAIVQRIITRHGGTVAAEGKTGQGATFYFTLP